MNFKVFALWRDSYLKHRFTGHYLLSVPSKTFKNHCYKTLFLSDTVIDDVWLDEANKWEKTLFL